MTVTIPQVEAAKPEGLTQTATALGQTASGLSSQIDTQRATIDALRAKWQGPASDAAIAKAQPTLLKLQDIHDALGRTQTALQQGGAALTQARTSVLNTVSELKGQGWQVGPDGNVSVRPGSPIDQYAKVSEPNAMKVQQLAATNSANVKALLAAFDTTDRQLSQNVRTAVGGLDGAPSKLGPGTRYRKRPATTTVPRSPSARTPKRSTSGGTRSAMTNARDCWPPGPTNWATSTASPSPTAAPPTTPSSSGTSTSPIR